MHPIKPEINGKDLAWKYDANGKNYICRNVKSFKSRINRWISKNIGWDKPGLTQECL